MIRTRNITCWSPQQRAALKAQLRRLASISPYLIVLALPGSILMLPILVWWQERRRSRQRAGVLPRT